MTDIDAITLETELVEGEAVRDIAKAVSARHSIARKHVMRLRRRNPEATPAGVIKMLERQYGFAITTAGALISAGTIAADVGIALIPGGGLAAAGVKGAAKTIALSVAKSGAERAAALLPAGDEQLQFEITAIFGLAVADIHAMDLDKDQAQALVYGLTNERVSQKQIATMATDLAKVAPEGAVGVGRSIAAGRSDWSNWASTLADTLPGGAAQSLVRTIQTGQLEDVRGSLSGKQQATIEYGVGAVAGGIERFVFGRDVIASSRTAFPEAPEAFPEHLAVLANAESEVDDLDAEPNRALAALEDAAKATGSWFGDTAGAVGGGISTGAVAMGTGVATAAGTVTRVFRSVDIDGDGIPDEAQALTAVKGAGGALAGAAGAVGGGVAGLFKRKNRD